MWWLVVSLSTLISAVYSLEFEVEVNRKMTCEDARLKCAYRVGCGGALQNYVVGCSSLLEGDIEINYCPEVCLHSLVALTSTQEGQELMACQCNDDYCENSKRRVEICRPQVVIANRNDTTVSCKVAQWICAADSQCSTALDYYNRYCRSMFHGKKCTHRCLNSISILRRQEKAAKLKTCKCDGHEGYDCKRIQQNMAVLCFHQKPTTEPPEITGDIDTNEITKETDRTSSANRLYSSVVLLVLLLTAIT